MIYDKFHSAQLAKGKDFKTHITEIVAISNELKSLRRRVRGSLRRTIHSKSSQRIRRNQNEHLKVGHEGKLLFMLSPFEARDTK